MKALGRKFFERDTLSVARELLGKKIVRIYRGKKIEGIITETEAYHGYADKASHASRGKTERTRVMFGEAGMIYVYLIYGMHYCLNIVTGKKDYPAAVLIRGINPVRSRSPRGGRSRAFSRAASNGINGPGRVCRFLKIDKKLNAKTLSRKSGFWINGGIKISSDKINTSKRIGVDYAGPIWSKKPWRYRIKDAML